MYDKFDIILNSYINGQFKQFDSQVAELEPHIRAHFVSYAREAWSDEKAFHIAYRIIEKH